MTNILRGTRAVSGGLSAVINASRISGPAPLGVFFDAIGTTSANVADVWRNILYSWDYGDTGSGTWTVSGLSRNSDIGAAVAAHVFETPGTYVVTLIANDGTTTNAPQVTITVTDPDVVYAGSATVFVSPSANYAAAPSGSVHQTTLPTSANGQYANKRIMLNKGETFGAISIGQQEQDWMICAGGTGAAPIVTSGSSSEGISLATGRPGSTNFAARGCITGLTVTNGIITQFANDLTIHKNTVNSLSGTTGIWLGGIGLFYGIDDGSKNFASSAYVVPNGIVVSQCDVHGNSSFPNCGLYSELGHKYAFIGVTTDQQQEHSIRLQAMYKLHIAHCQFPGHSNSGGKHSIKLHSGGTASFNGTLGGYNTPPSVETSSPLHYSPMWSTKYGNIANNLLGGSSDNNTWMIAVRPQNAQEETAEGIEDVFIENNSFWYDGDASFLDINAMGRRITYLGNIRAAGSPAHAMSYGVSTSPSGYSTQLDPAWAGPYYTSR